MIHYCAILTQIMILTDRQRELNYLLIIYSCKKVEISFLCQQYTLLKTNTVHLCMLYFIER